MAAKQNLLMICMGGHIATQNPTFKQLMRRLQERFNFFGGVNGLEVIETGDVVSLGVGDLPEDKAGFVAGSGRYSIKDKKTGEFDPQKMQIAEDFFKQRKFDVVVGSGGDDHGIQLGILQKHFGRFADFYVINKTMDNDLGGKDGVDGAPFTDFTNGFYTAVKTGVDMMHQHWNGAWTNNCPYLVSHFGRDTNWVGIALAYWGLADRFIYGELEGDDAHPIDRIYNLIRESQDENEQKYGRRMAMVVVPEGTRISGIEHETDSLDPSGHPKLNPEQLAIRLREVLKDRFGLKAHNVGITYEMRNFTPPSRDRIYGQMSADVIAKAILDRYTGVESTLKIHGEDVVAGIEPIEKVASQRFAGDYEGANGRQFFDRNTFRVTGEIGEYYMPLFGERRDLTEIVPGKLKR